MTKKAAHSYSTAKVFHLFFKMLSPNNQTHKIQSHTYSHNKQTQACTISHRSEYNGCSVGSGRRKGGRRLQQLKFKLVKSDFIQSGSSNPVQSGQSEATPALVPDSPDTPTYTLTHHREGDRAAQQEHLTKHMTQGHKHFVSKSEIYLSTQQSI